MKDDCLYKGVCNDDCSKSCMRYSQMKYMLDHSNLPKNQQCIHKLIPDSCDLKAFEYLQSIQLDIENFVRGGNNLYIWSRQVGNGKTTWSIKLLLQYFDSVWDRCAYTQLGVFVNVPNYLSKCKASISNPEIDLSEIQYGLLNAPIAICDDVIVSKLSNYDYSSLESFIDSRLFEGKTTIFTGNYSPDELESVAGPRLRSRICSGEIVELRGKDRR